MAQKWTVEFTVADSWVADGFDLTDERAFSMLENDLAFAYSNELSAKVVGKPDPEVVRKLQSGELEPSDDSPSDEPESRKCRDCDGCGHIDGDGFSDETKTCASCGGRGSVPA